jgi:hypothetical protein
MPAKAGIRAYTEKNIKNQIITVGWVTPLCVTHSFYPPTQPQKLIKN